MQLFGSLKAILGLVLFLSMWRKKVKSRYNSKCCGTEALEQKLMDICQKYLPASGCEGLMPPLTLETSSLLDGLWKGTCQLGS